MKKYLSPQVDIMQMNEVMMQDLTMSVGETVDNQSTNAPSRTPIRIN